jgi:hypothetical protein
MKSAMRRLGHPLFGVVALCWITFDVVNLVHEPRSTVGRLLSDLIGKARPTGGNYTSPPVLMTREHGRFLAIDFESESTDALLRANDRKNPPLIISITLTPSQHVVHPVFTYAKVETKTRSVFDSAEITLSPDELMLAKKAASEALKATGQQLASELFLANSDTTQIEFRPLGLLRNTLSLVATITFVVQLLCLKAWRRQRNIDREQRAIAAGRCPRCHYEMRETNTCPECGRTV